MMGRTDDVVGNLMRKLIGVSKPEDEFNPKEDPLSRYKGCEYCGYSRILREHLSLKDKMVYIYCPKCKRINLRWKPVEIR
jgi:hypothetical protein